MIDYRSFDDNFDMNESMSAFKGHVKITAVDEDGSNEVLVDKDNLILLRTRLFVMKRLFGLGESVEAANGYIENDNRKICLFKIGSGGADVTATPFQPFIPKYNDTDLNKPVGFIHVTEMKYADPDFESNPSIMTKDEYKDISNKGMYYRTKNGAAKAVSNIVSYDAKAFNTDSEVIFNKENNTLYANLVLEISNIDARGEFINELGLLLAEEIYVNVDNSADIMSKEEYEAETNEALKVNYVRSWRDEELATRLTFDTISLQSSTRSLVIEYRVYV